MTNTIRLLLLLPSLSSSLTRSASSSFQNAWKLKKERRWSVCSQFLLLYHSAEHSSVLVLLEKEELVTPPFYFVVYQEEKRKLDQRHHPTSSRESLHVPTYHSTTKINTCSCWIVILFEHVTRREEEGKEEVMNRSLVQSLVVVKSRICYTYWIGWCC